MITKEEKLQIIASHQHTLSSRKYSLELDLLKENAVVTPDAKTLGNIQNQIDEVNAQVEALASEEAIVNAQ